MLMRTLLVVTLIVGVVRFGLLIWTGHRDGRVKSASPWSPYLDRQTQPISYWATMSVHWFAVAAFIGCVIAIVLGLVPTGI
jgi:hypothetical protein